jgi:hypothetical protein
MPVSSRITDATSQPRVIASVGHKLGGGGQGTTAAGTFGEALKRIVIKGLCLLGKEIRLANLHMK